MKRTMVVAVLLCFSLTIAACDNQPDSSVSRQAKQSPSPSGQAPAAGHPSAPSAPSQSAHSDLHFKIPEGWQQDPTPRQMREATLLIGEGDKSAELVVTRLASQFGDMGANINRWRGQIGLAPLEDPSTVKPRTVKTPVGEAKLYKLEGSDKASIIALVQQGEQTWFFRLTGDKTTVLENEPKLEQLLSSLAVGKREQV